jgi:hypothetical protein
MYGKIITYLLILVLIVLLFVVSCYYISLNKTTNNIEILQAETPDFNKIQILLNQNQPTIFRQVLYGWEPIIHIFDASLDDIDYLINNNQDFNKDILDCLSNYSMFLSMGWEYKFLEKTNNVKDNHFILQRNYRQLFIQIMGTQRIYLVHPSQSNLIETQIMDETFPNNNNKPQTVSKVNFWNKQETSKEPFNKLEYTEIILREGNILFIPKGWWYLKVSEEDNMCMEAINVSLFSLIPF